MPSKTKPLTDAELAAYEAKRDLAAELLQSVLEMKAGQVRVISSPVIEARNKLHQRALPGSVRAHPPDLRPGKEREMDPLEDLPLGRDDLPEVAHVVDELLLAHGLDSRGPGDGRA